MKKIMVFAAAIAATAAFSASAEDAVIAATLRSDGSTNTWTQGDLQDALGLLNRKYWRDMETDSGRRKWHGDRLGQYVFTNGTELVRVDLYADGFVATQRAVRVGSKIKDPEAAAKAAAEAKRRADEARAAWEAANLPPELAALRAAQRAAAETNTVTVTVEGN